MNYYEIKITFSIADPWKEIFTSLLADIGCDSFMDGEQEEELLCYIPEANYDEGKIKTLLEHHEYPVSLRYTVQAVEQQDWNAVWESNYESVTIADRCYIRAPFHEPRPDIEYEIVIEPKMSFGTAHHETTSLMIEYLLEEDVKGKSFLDMGAGTGVLAILAHLRGASPITAIDNDEWAYKNNIENDKYNHCEDITVKLGDAATLAGCHFQIIFANINRNILLNDIPAYAPCLEQGGYIFFSGFYAGDDLESIKKRCAEFGIDYVSHKEKNHWVAAKFHKQQNRTS